MASTYLKKNRIFSPIKKYAWLFILLVAFGGLWYPKLGLLMIPMMAALALMGFFRGKSWCGNFCPHGSLFDGLIMPLSPNKKIPGLLRSKTVAAAAFIFFMFMLGRRLSNVLVLWGTVSFLDKLGYVFVFNYLAVTIVGTFLAVIITPRAWCAFCPMGTFQVLAYKAGKTKGLNKTFDRAVTMEEEKACTNCAICSKVCPMQLAPQSGILENNRFESHDCIRCSACVKHCPVGALSLRNGFGKCSLKQQQQKAAS